MGEQGCGGSGGVSRLLLHPSKQLCTVEADSTSPGTCQSRAQGSLGAFCATVAHDTALAFVCVTIAAVAAAAAIAAAAAAAAAAC